MKKRILKRAESSGRVDDNLEALKKRFNTYSMETKPVIDHFRSKGKLVVVSQILLILRYITPLLTTG